MAGIASGVGLLSGLPTQQIIDQLIAIDSRPLATLQGRVSQIQAQRTAFTDVSARLLALRNSITRFDEPSFFRKSKATSTNESVLSAVAEEGAVQGTFQFQVRSLVTNHQIISRGFANADQQPIGTGELSFEIGNGRLNRETSLESLNNGEDVRRGRIEITDSAGESVTIDLSTAITVRDVLDEINAQTDIDVTARAVGTRIVLQDESGTAGLTIRDIGGGFMARDLGIAQQADENGVINGSQILSIHNGTRIDQLNDGNGLDIGRTNADLDITVGSQTFTVGLRGLLTRDTHIDVLNSGNGVRTGTFRITNRAGETADVTIDETVTTVGDIIDRIEATGLDLTVTLGAAFGQLSITDNSAPAPDPDVELADDAPTFSIEDVEGGAAADLGLSFETTDASQNGNIIYRVDTVGDVIRAINYAVDADGNRNELVQAQISSTGLGLELEGQGGVAFSVGVPETAVSSNVAEALGISGDATGGSITGNDLLAGLNSVLTSSLRGGQGVDLSTVFVGAGESTGPQYVDLSGATSVQEIIERFNAVSDLSNVRAEYNDAGNGITFVSLAGEDEPLVLGDFDGSTIQDLFGTDVVDGGIARTFDGQLSTGNLQLQYISRSTSLESLGNGRGVSQGSFRITGSNGQSVSVNLTDSQTTVGDVLDRINALAFDGLVAQINENGDGIELIDSTDGTVDFVVESVDGSTTARDLNLLGEATTFVDDEGNTQRRIDGSFEFSLSVDADDTLTDVRSKINDLGLDVRATIINDGSGTDPYHLILTSEVTGTQGQLVLDTGSTGLSFDTLVQAQDAVVFFGGEGAENPVVLTSSTNSLNNVLENVTINLSGTSDDPIEVSVSEDTDAIVEDLNTFVSGYNDVINRLDELTQFDSESNERAVLFGDSTVNVIQSRLRNLITQRVPDAVPGFDRLTFVGVSFESGGRLAFDEQRFRDVLAENPEAIEALFTDSENGIGKQFDEALDNLTRSFDGTIARKDTLLGGREDLLEDRITALQEQLERKRTRLERQFQGLESSLAGLQDAQTALGSIAGLVG